jgi:ribosomal protein S18 acetylase RimI-like enzyme
MSMAIGESLRRLPFAPGDADAVVAFCKAHGGIHDVRMLLDLTSDPAGVFVIGDDTGPTLAATAVDRIHNAADAANLELLAVRAPIATPAFMRLVIEPAVAFVRAGERRALNVLLSPSSMPVEGAEDLEYALRARGFSHAYDTFEMRRPGALPPPEAPGPLPAGWSWEALDGGRVDAAHAALAEMFRDALGTSAMSLADFRQAVVSGVAVWRVLLDGERIAGLVRTALHGARGELRVLGRAPAYRGRGIGPRLVAEGLRVLRAGGAGDVDLTVETDNQRALELYRAFGFEVGSRTPVFVLTLR